MPRGRRGVGTDADPRGRHRVARRAKAKASATASSSAAPEPKVPGAKASGPTDSKASGAKASGAKAAAKKVAPKASASKVSDSDDDFAAPPPPPPPAEGAPLSLARPPKRAKRDPRVYVDAIGGSGHVWFDKDYVAPAIGSRAYPNWRFKCPHHDDCFRTLGLGGANIRVVGNLEPLAFLHVWVDTPPSDKGHIKTNPKAADVRAFYNDHLAELQALAAACGAPTE